MIFKKRNKNFYSNSIVGLLININIMYRMLIYIYIYIFVKSYVKSLRIDFKDKIKKVNINFID